MENLSNVLFAIIGVSVMLGGIYYWIKERKDKDSIKVYGITTMIGIIVTIISVFNL